MRSMAGTKFDYAPLLAPGRHYRQLTEIEDLCVRPFLKSAMRPNLFARLCTFVQAIKSADICCEILVNGSFLTVKNDPSDVDVALLMDPDVAESLNADQEALVDAINDNIFIDKVDAFAETLFPIGHASFRLDGNERLWSEQYGSEHNGVYLKGIAVLRVGETDVGLRIRR
ncbi:DUF6932 family protein [Methylorubrum sp. GM97]|jgi:hypothetical protein|uniref:DUF6932 family protein n=1 Tax=Methylorubrum sp. GM97 TaxID=2938232 RepID=UPI0021C44CDD|nr:hypothetical protein [Methylorubrum sp. GM97]